MGELSHTKNSTIPEASIMFSEETQRSPSWIEIFIIIHINKPFISNQRFFLLFLLCMCVCVHLPINMAHEIIIPREKREGGKTGCDRGVRGPVGCCQPDSYGSAPLILSDDLSIAAL